MSKIASSSLWSVTSMGQGSPVDLVWVTVRCSIGSRDMERSAYGKLDQKLGKYGARSCHSRWQIPLSLLSERYFISLSPRGSGCCSPTQVIDTLKLGKLSSLLLSEPHDHSSEGRDDHWWLALVDMWGLENSEFKMLISVTFTKSP